MENFYDPSQTTTKHRNWFNLHNSHPNLFSCFAKLLLPLILSNKLLIILSEQLQLHFMLLIVHHGRI